MKSHIRFGLVALALSFACSFASAQPPAELESMPAKAQISPFHQAEVDEAAGAYVALYADTIDKSLLANAYKEKLALRHLNAESCLDSRAYRLLSKELSREEKDALVLAFVSKEKLDAYAELARGYYPRANGLELFSCANAGLVVSNKVASY